MFVEKRNKRLSYTVAMFFSTIVTFCYRYIIMIAYVNMGTCDIL